MLLLGQMGEDEPLPVAVEIVLPAGRIQPDSAAPGGGLQNKMHLGIVPEGLIVPHALDGIGDGLLIENPALGKGYG